MSDLIVSTREKEGKGGRENWIEVKVINILLLEEQVHRAEASKVKCTLKW